MSAERNPREGSEKDNVRKLRIVKATEELPSRAIPPVLEWGPSGVEISKLIPARPASSLGDIFTQAGDDN